LAQRPQVISEHAAGLDLFLDLEAMDDQAIERARKRLTEALAAVSAKKPRPEPAPAYRVGFGLHAGTVAPLPSSFSAGRGS
jgi:hypothetical protein